MATQHDFGSSDEELVVSDAPVGWWARLIPFRWPTFALRWPWIHLASSHIAAESASRLNLNLNISSAGPGMLNFPSSVGGEDSAVNFISLRLPTHPIFHFI
jgi:hypothetical protein